jgi:hypothetical protein
MTCYFSGSHKTTLGSIWRLRLLVSMMAEFTDNFKFLTDNFIDKRTFTLLCLAGGGSGAVLHSYARAAPRPCCALLMVPGGILFGCPGGCSCCCSTLTRSGRATAGVTCCWCAQEHYEGQVGFGQGLEFTRVWVCRVWFGLQRMRVGARVHRNTVKARWVLARSRAF